MYIRSFKLPPGSAPKTDIHAVFLNDVKKALGAEKSAHLFQTIQNYKKTDNYENLVATVVSLFTERNENFNLLPSRFLITTDTQFFNLDRLLNNFWPKVLHSMVSSFF